MVLAAVSSDIFFTIFLSLSLLVFVCFAIVDFDYFIEWNFHKPLNKVLHSAWNAHSIASSFPMLISRSLWVLSSPFYRSRYQELLNYSNIDNVLWHCVQMVIDWMKFVSIRINWRYWLWNVLDKLLFNQHICCAHEHRAAAATCPNACEKQTELRLRRVYVSMQQMQFTVYKCTLFTRKPFRVNVSCHSYFSKGLSAHHTLR